MTGLLVLGAAAAVVVGLLFAAGALRWFGRLPGDIRVGGRNARLYVPLTSMLLLSLLLTLVMYLLRRFF